VLALQSSVVFPISVRLELALRASSPTVKQSKNVPFLAFVQILPQELGLGRDSAFSESTLSSPQYPTFVNHTQLCFDTASRTFYRSAELLKKSLKESKKSTSTCVTWYALCVPYK
jgi:hypothetical protein